VFLISFLFDAVCDVGLCFFKTDIYFYFYVKTYFESNFFADALLEHEFI